MGTTTSTHMDHTTDPIDVAEVLAPHITDTPQNPSSLARKAKIRTSVAYRGLDWLIEHDHAIAVGNGAWTKYRQRQFGERNR